MMKSMIGDKYLTLKVDLLQGIPNVKLQNVDSHAVWADGPVGYEVQLAGQDGTLTVTDLKGARVHVADNQIIISGILAGLEVCHQFATQDGVRGITENITLKNPTDHEIRILDLSIGIQKEIASGYARIPADLAGDQVVAVPFRNHPSIDDEISKERRILQLQDFMTYRGTRPMAGTDQIAGLAPSDRWYSEGWTWMHGTSGLGIFKYNQSQIEYAVLRPVFGHDAIKLRIGGSALVSGHPSCLQNLKPGEELQLGQTTFIGFCGDYKQGCYTYRDYMDALGMRFPSGYNPPLQWNELYDNAEWSVLAFSRDAVKRNSRRYSYTRELIFKEARKAVEYSCQALYLDPGWDTDFGSLIWGQEWLGDRKSFIHQLSDVYGLRLCLHTVMASWVSTDTAFGEGIKTWPSDAMRQDERGNTAEGRLCMGSRQYIQQYVERMLDHIRDGVAFIMMDGNSYTGACFRKDHGHAVPYGIEEHWQAQMDIIRQVHSACPDVIIELHEPVTSALQRYSPIYYQYGATGSYNEVWAFEMMWHPLAYIKNKKANILYYYNLCCNIPLYVHVDLKYDNPYCLVLWWYASTCRHFGIGGSHEDLWVREAQKKAMKQYAQLQRFYQRGEFYGFGEEVHVHVLKEEQAFVYNLFNLSDEERDIEAVIRLQDIGLDPRRWYVCNGIYYYDLDQGHFIIKKTMPPWSARVYHVYPVEECKKCQSTE